MSRISSLDEGYVSGQLSLYPETQDDKSSLYQATNNSETTLKQTLTYSGQNIIVDDASSFPPNGLLRISLSDGSVDAELVYYGQRTNSVFSALIRGFAASNQGSWPAINTLVSNAVMAEHHNAVKDAIVNVETNLGTENLPTATSLNGLLTQLEVKHLAPQAIFRAYPLVGISPLLVTFQNFSNRNIIRTLWDFGDGLTSLERNPSHIYAQEGIYTVKLSVITSTGTQGIATKSNYITVDNSMSQPFAYWKLISGQTYEFVDQTDGDVRQRYWIYGDGQTDEITDPNKHTITHTYNIGSYEPSLVVAFANQKFKRFFMDPIIL